jgi:uncharacterized membrane protein YdbT with pleckstrin-like domain
VSYPDRLLSPDEKVIREFRPHWLALVGPLIWAIVTIAAAVAALTLLDSPANWIAAVGAFVIWIVASVRRVADWATTHHVITNERVIYRAGVFSRRGKEIPLEVINDVAFSQTPLERIFRSGDLLIESAGEMGQSRYTDIRDPEGLQSLIYQVRESRMMHMRGSGERSAAAELEALARLRENGVLSDEEFEAQKRKLLGD